MFHRLSKFLSVIRNRSHSIPSDCSASSDQETYALCIDRVMGNERYDEAIRLRDLRIYFFLVRID